MTGASDKFNNRIEHQIRAHPLRTVIDKFIKDGFNVDFGIVSGKSSSAKTVIEVFVNELREFLVKSKLFQKLVGK